VSLNLHLIYKTARADNPMFKAFFPTFRKFYNSIKKRLASNKTHETLVAWLYKVPEHRDFKRKNESNASKFKPYR